MSKKQFKIAVIAECVILLVVLLICAFTHFEDISESAYIMQLRVSVHSFMIGSVLTLLTALALSAKKAWKENARYIAFPLIFTAFGVLMQVVM